jgi:hypothetical protein
MEKMFSNKAHCSRMPSDQFISVEIDDRIRTVLSCGAMFEGSMRREWIWRALRNCRSISAVEGRSARL